jgi:hypothetical protein
MSDLYYLELLGASESTDDVTFKRLFGEFTRKLAIE